MIRTKERPKLEVRRKAAGPVAQAGGLKPPPGGRPPVAAAGDEDPLMSPVLVAFTQSQKRWLDREAAARKCRRSEVVRAVIAEAMK